MNSVKRRGKENFLIKTWERCRSMHLGREKSAKSVMPAALSKSKSCGGKKSKTDDKRKQKPQVAPQGCFTVYVGEEKQRFVIKTEYANHPLFKMLLEDAEMEYGYRSEGPILLPCDVDLFYKVLAEMDSREVRYGWGFVYGSCSPFNPSYRLGKSDMAKGCGSYDLLTPSPMLKMNLV